MQTLSYPDFTNVVVNGRKNVNTAQESVMPAFGTNRNVMCYLDDIFIYLRARANDAVPRARPAKHEGKPDFVTKFENSCLGSERRMGERLPALRSRPSFGGYRLAGPCAIGTWAAAVFATAATVLLPAQPLAQQAVERPQSLLELIDPKVFRVCADPHNMPFSTDKGEGFENKLAELFADKLGKGLAYAWYPQATGFVRNTLAAHKCDVMMGAPQGDDLVQVTNPYYRTAYALVFAGTASTASTPSRMRA